MEDHFSQLSTGVLAQKRERDWDSTALSSCVDLSLFLLVFSLYLDCYSSVTLDHTVYKNTDCTILVFSKVDLGKEESSHSVIYDEGFISVSEAR